MHDFKNNIQLLHVFFYTLLANYTKFVAICKVVKKLSIEENKHNNKCHLIEESAALVKLIAYVV